MINISIKPRMKPKNGRNNTPMIIGNVNIMNGSILPLLLEIKPAITLVMNRKIHVTLQNAQNKPVQFSIKPAHPDFVPMERTSNSSLEGTIHCPSLQNPFRQS